MTKFEEEIEQAIRPYSRGLTKVTAQAAAKVAKKYIEMAYHAGHGKSKFHNRADLWMIDNGII